MSGNPRRARRAFEKSFRAKVALAAVKGDKTLSELASQFDVHANQVSAWRQTLIERAAELFEDGRRKPGGAETDATHEELYEHIGRLKMEVEWLKKKSAQLA
jgi:transposase-like protein